MDCLPEDMERRRLAGLEKFVMNHPDHPTVPLLLRQVRGAELREPEAEVEVEGEQREDPWYHWLRECQQQKPVQKPVRQAKRENLNVRLQGSVNKWDKESSLELIEAMRKFEETLAELSIQGIRVTSESRWGTIARNVPNRCGLDAAKFTRSCKVHFTNLCRIYKVPRRNSKGEDSLDFEVRQALEEYFQLSDENLPQLLRRKGFEVNSSGNRRENKPTEKIDPGDNYFRMPAAAKIAPGDNYFRMPAAAKIAVEKHWNKMPHSLAFGNSPPQVMKTTARPHNNFSWEDQDHGINQNTEWGERIRIANHGGLGPGAGEVNEDENEDENEDSYGKELPNFLPQDQRPKAPTMDSNATLERWDTARTLKLLAAMATVGAKAENRWEQIASLVPNDGKLDPHVHLHCCKEQYRGMLSIYRRESCRENSGQKLLPDEVYAELDKLLQLSTSLKAHNLKNEEIHRVEKISTAPTRVAVKPVFKTGLIEKKHVQEQMGISKSPGFNKKSNREAAEENPAKIGFTKEYRELQTRVHPEINAIGITNRSPRDDTMPLDSDAESEMRWETYRRSIVKKRSGEEVDEPYTEITSKVPVSGGDLKGKGICKTYADMLCDKPSKPNGRKTLKSALPTSKDSNQAMDIDKASCQDSRVHLGSDNRTSKLVVNRGGPLLQRTSRDPGEEKKHRKDLERTLRDPGGEEKKRKKDLEVGVPNRFSDEENRRKDKQKMDCRAHEENRRKGKQKMDWQGDAEGKGWSDPVAQKVAEVLRDLGNSGRRPDHTRDNHDKISSNSSRGSEADHCGIEKGEQAHRVEKRACEFYKGQQNETPEKAPEKRTFAAGFETTLNAKLQHFETKINDKQVGKTRGITDRINDPCGRRKDRLPCTLLNSSPVKVMGSANRSNRSSSDDSIHSEDPPLNGMQNTKVNISYPGKRGSSSGPQNDMISQNPSLVRADKRKVERNPLAHRSGNCAGLDRSNIKFDLDLKESSWDDSMHGEEGDDDNAMEGAQSSKTKISKRDKIMKSMLKKRAKRTQAQENSSGGEE